MIPRTTSPVAVRLLGGFSMAIDREPVNRWRAGKARGMFQYLLMNRGKLVSRDRLYEVLWPAAPNASGGSSLKVAAHALREVLGRTPAEAGLALVCRDRGYLLRAGDVWTDVDEFERCRAARDDRAAAELYRDDFLRGEDGDWVVEQREWYRAAVLRTLDRLREDALRRGDRAELVRWCRRSLELDPYREDTYRTMMAAHARSGELDRVVAWYRLCHRRLRDGLGVGPSVETHDLLVEALRHGLTPTGPGGVRLTAPGAQGRRGSPVLLRSSA